MVGASVVPTAFVTVLLRRFWDSYHSQAALAPASALAAKLFSTPAPSLLALGGLLFYALRKYKVSGKIVNVGAGNIRKLKFWKRAGILKKDPKQRSWLSQNLSSCSTAISDLTKKISKSVRPNACKHVCPLKVNSEEELETIDLTKEDISKKRCIFEEDEPFYVLSHKDSLVNLRSESAKFHDDIDMDCYISEQQECRPCKYYHRGEIIDSLDLSADHSNEFLQQLLLDDKIEQLAQRVEEYIPTYDMCNRGTTTVKSKTYRKRRIDRITPQKELNRKNGKLRNGKSYSKSYK